MEELIGYKNWLAGSSAMLPYVCFLIGFVCLVTIIWVSMAFFLVVFKFGIVLFRQHQLENGFEPQAKVGSIKLKETRSDQNTNESVAQDGSETKENEAGESGTNNQPQPRRNVVKAKATVTKMKLNKGVHRVCVDYVMLMLNMVQKLFSILSIFLLMTVIIHLVLLETATRSNNTTSVFIEEDNTKLTIKCSLCEYSKNIDKLEVPVSLDVPIKDGAKHTDGGAKRADDGIKHTDDGVKHAGDVAKRTDDVAKPTGDVTKHTDEGARVRTDAKFEEEGFVSLPYRKGARPTLPASVFAP